MSSIKTVHDSSQFIQDVSTKSNTLAPTPTTLQNSNRKKQTPFTLNNFRTKHLLHQTPFRRGTFYTRHLLHQKTFTPNIKHLLHQAHFTPHNFCPPDIFYRPNTAFSPDFQQTPDFESKASESRSANRQYASIHFRKKRVVRGFCQETHVLHDTIRTPVPSPDCIPNALPNGNHTLVHKRPFQNLHFTTVLSVRPPRNAKKVALNSHMFERPTSTTCRNGCSSTSKLRISPTVLSVQRTGNRTRRQSNPQGAMAAPEEVKEIFSKSLRLTLKRKLHVRRFL